MKYIIDVPDGTKWIEAYYTVDYLRYQGDTIMVDSLIPYTEPDREAVENEVWEFARRIICPSDCCEDSISKYTEEFLGIPSHKARAIFKDLSYQEAKAKYEAWSKQNIHEGDEVMYNSRTRAVVLKPETEEKYGTILTSEFATIAVSHDDLEKTGRHFPEVEELLKKMREEE